MLLSEACLGVASWAGSRARILKPENELPPCFREVKTMGDRDEYQRVLAGLHHYGLLEWIRPDEVIKHPKTGQELRNASFGVLKEDVMAEGLGEDRCPLRLIANLIPVNELSRGHQVEIDMLPVFILWLKMELLRHGGLGASCGRDVRGRVSL